MRMLKFATLGLLLAGPALAQETQVPAPEICTPVDEAQIAALFDRWNAALRSGSAEQVAALYADDAVLLPTLSDTPRYTPAERIDYFEHFLAKRPNGHVDERHVWIGCNSAVDAGVYTFVFGKTGERVQARYSYSYAFNGKAWHITSHHSSLMPEAQRSAKE